MDSTRYLAAALAVLTSVALLAMGGCSSTSELEIMSEAKVLESPLPSSVDIQSLLSLAEFAVKDRECISVPEPPMTGMHALPYSGYAQCVYESPSTACGATIADLRTLRTLMERDPRLRAIANFDDVLDRINEGCDRRGAGALLSSSIPTWAARQLRRCPSTPNQPVLISTAIGLRPPKEFVELEDTKDLDRSREFGEWAARCGVAKGSSFVSDHCVHGGNRRYTSYGVPAAPRTFKKLGIESYYCSNDYRSIPAAAR